MGESGLRANRGVAACAVSALATVFLVQQGEHGPLVVYELQASAAAPAVVPDPAPATEAQDNVVIPSRAPKTLGTLVIPAGSQSFDTPFAPAPFIIGDQPAEKAPGAEPYRGVTLHVPDRESVVGIAEALPDDDPMINQETGQVLTLKDVSDALSWRRDTAEKLRQVPVLPRF